MYEKTDHLFSLSHLENTLENVKDLLVPRMIA